MNKLRQKFAIMKLSSSNSSTNNEKKDLQTSIPSERDLLACAINAERRASDMKTVYNMSKQSSIVQPQLFSKYISLLKSIDTKKDQRHQMLRVIKEMIKQHKNGNNLTFNQLDKALTRIRAVMDKEDIQNEITEELTDELGSFLYMIDNDDDDDLNLSITSRTSSATIKPQPSLPLSLPETPLTLSIDQTINDSKRESNVYCKDVSTQTLLTN